MKMNKFSLVSLAIAASFAIPQLAFAQTSEPFDFSGPTTAVSYGTYYPGWITIAGTFLVSGTSLGDDGGFEISNITGTYDNSGSGVSGNISLYSGLGYGTYESKLTSADGSWYYDNLYYPAANAPGTTHGEFDLQGLLFYVGPAGNPDEWEVNFYAVSGTAYQVEESKTGCTQCYLGGATDISITPANTLGVNGDGIDVPEGTSLFMLALCGLGLAGAFLFKTRQTGLFRNA